MANRRDFFKVAAIGSAAILAQGCSSISQNSKTMKLKKQTKILFQGDSITDGRRNRNSQGNPNDISGLGIWYPLQATGNLLVKYPQADLQIYNRGISGHGVKHLQDRWQADCVDMKPDILSILIGVNDFWHRAKADRGYFGTADSYDKGYDQLLAETVKALPDTKLIICEPFILKTGAVNDDWYPAFDGYRAAARKLAKKYNATFVPFQQMFDDACKLAEAKYWLYDGVHPSLAGSQLMAEKWMQTCFGC
ncbi:MAG: SGNH/GDSL hydrolase family protein [Phycisphaerae bacterium]|nr:SGNH/GDSL hydrolase family protein [Phycisphaerae bacterium]